MTDRSDLTRALVPVLFGLGIVCAVFGIGGVLICVFMTEESAWQPIITAAVAFGLLSAASTAALWFRRWWDSR